MAGGTLVVLTRERNGKIVTMKIPNPRPPGPFAALLTVLAAAADLDAKSAMTTAELLASPLQQHVRDALEQG